MNSSDSCKVLLPDGRKVDLCTPTGADEFLRCPCGGDFKYFSTNINDASQIRRKKKLNAADKSRLTMLYFSMDSVAKYGTPQLFRDMVPQSEIEVWLDHVISQLQKKTEDQRWASTGNLEQHDAFILNPCVSMFMHPVPVALAFEKGFFKVVADFIHVRKGNGRALPSTDISDTISLIVSNTAMTCRYGFDNPWTAEKIFQKFDASGILAQFMRCSTVPQTYDSVLDDWAPGLLKTYDELLTCVLFLEEKIKKGEPCGDTVAAILEGKDGHTTKRPAIIQKLKMIASYAALLQPIGQRAGSLKHCRYCNKMEMSEEFQMTLKRCSRCQSAFYCSTACQRADWKTHKKTCLPATDEHQKQLDASEQAVLNFAQRNYVDIMYKLVKACDEAGLMKNDMLLAIDFVPDQNGKAPALQDPPEFTIAAVKGFTEGSRPYEPDWFYKHQDSQIYEHNIKGAIAAIKDQHRRLTSNRLLCLVHNSGGGTFCYTIQLMSTDDGTQLMSDQAVEAFRSAIREEDFEPLSRIFRDRKDLLSIKRILGVKNGISVPDDERLDRVRMVLNALGGDFPLSGNGRNF